MTAIAPVITIDGPSGAGKGTLCKAMAEALQWHLLDSGAIYRVLALAALHHHVDVASEEALVPLAARAAPAGACRDALKPQKTKPRHGRGLSCVGADARQGRNRGDPDFLCGHRHGSGRV